MYRKVEREIRDLEGDQFKEIIKFIPSVQQDAFYLLYYLGIRFKDIVQLRGVNISEDGIWIKKKYFWPENPNQELLVVRKRLLETAQQFPDTRLFEAQKPIIKAVTDLPRAFQKGFERYSHFQGKPTDKIEGRLPGFLVLGTPKSATTWLYHSLKAHPDIYLPDKELEFFGSYRFHYGINWYKQQFLGWNSEKVAGDVSIGYFQSLEAPKRICEHLDCKHLKLIVLLREPIDRALSFYEMRVLKGNLLSSFEESIKIPYYRKLYIESGHYYRYYKNYLESFSKDQLLILLHDEMKANPDKEISKVCDFIGVRSDYYPSISNKKANVGKSIRYPNMHYYLTYLGFIFQAAFPQLNIGYRIRSLLLKISFQVNFYKTRKDYNLDPIVRKYLEGEFRPSNERLREMSGIELGDNWKYL